MSPKHLLNLEVLKYFYRMHPKQKGVPAKEGESYYTIWAHDHPFNDYKEDVPMIVEWWGFNKFWPFHRAHDDYEILELVRQNPSWISSFNYWLQKEMKRRRKRSKKKMPYSYYYEVGDYALAVLRMGKWSGWYGK